MSQLFERCLALQRFTDDVTGERARRKLREAIEQRDRDQRELATRQTRGRTTALIKTKPVAAA